MTGATGMPGRAVVPELLRRNMQVRAASRRPGRSSDRVEWVVADVVTGRPEVPPQDELHRAAKPPRTKKAIRVSATIALFEMESSR